MLSFTVRAAAVCLLLGGSGTALAEDEVRISIADRARSVVVAGDRLSIFDGESGDRLYAWSGGGTAQIRRGGPGLQVVAGAKAVAAAKRLLVEAVDSVRVDQGVYFGRIEVRVHRGRILVINRLPLETYLLGIVGSEMSPAWPIEALKAQAVAARTYAVQRRMMMRAANRPYDLESSVLSQVYNGAERIRPSVIRAVKETRGEVLAFTHDVVQALFHSTCGGRTVSAKAAFGREVPYLKPRRCKWCRQSSRHRWSLEIPLSEMSMKLRRARLAKHELTGVSRASETNLVRLEEGRRKRQVSPKKVRRAVGYGELYSTRFTAETKGHTVHIHGRGFGHGVGMCQWGAKGMAEAGRSYRQILGYYYRGVRLKRIY